LTWGAALGAAALPQTALALSAPMGERQLSFYNLHTGEQLKSTYWVDGQYLPAARSEIDYILRDFRTGDVSPIDAGLLDTLVALKKMLGNDAPFHVISGYRSPKTNAALAQKSNGVAKKSYHMSGLAIDIRLPGSDLTDLHRAAVALKRGGVGYYPKSDFVHIDVGPVRSW
jgi:uncharacterized protein YcbK (DUF882 family)